MVMLTPSPKKLAVSIAIAVVVLLAASLILSTIVRQSTKPSPTDSLDPRKEKAGD
jgi:hypothetical protein